jgi:hypothetical protein
MYTSRRFGQVSSRHRLSVLSRKKSPIPIWNFLAFLDQLAYSHPQVPTPVEADQVGNQFIFIQGLHSHAIGGSSFAIRERS